MNVSIVGVQAVRGDWSVSAQGVFQEGIHLISGDIGSGKTTLALLLAGLYLPESGTIERQDIGSATMVCQFPEFHVTAPDLRNECKAWGVDPAIVLAETGLTAKMMTSPLDLSRGELKRLILACVLAKHHDLLILDEPFSSLDCGEKARLCAAFSLRKNGITIIFTHEQVHFPRVDRIWEIQEGRLHDRGPLPSALSRWDHAPAQVKNLVAGGRVPVNISQDDLREAACRT